MAAFVIHPVSHVRRCLLALRHFCLFCSGICGFFLLIFVFMCVIACGFYVFVVIAVLRICDYYLLLRIYIYVIYLCYQLIVIPTTLSCESHMRGSFSAELRDPFVRESFVSCDPSDSLLRLACQCQCKYYVKLLRGFRRK